jgi:hypothetical protein
LVGRFPIWWRRQQLFVYRDLWVWIDNPFQLPPILETLPEQLALQLAK